jgi:hypothetical protein
MGQQEHSSVGTGTVRGVRAIEQCCGTLMIYCGSASGSYFGQVLVPVLALGPVPVLNLDLFSTVFHQQNMCTKSCLFNARNSIVSQKVGL